MCQGLNFILNQMEGKHLVKRLLSQMFVWNRFAEAKQRGLQRAPCYLSRCI